MKRFGALVMILCWSLFSYSQTKVDSAINVLKGTWRWDYQRGGFAPFPPSPASFSAHLIFSQDAQDSLNQTLTYQRYRGNSLEKSARTSITWQYNNGYYDVFNFLPDVFPFLGNDTIASDFWFVSDTLEITWQGADIPTFGFLRDTTFNPHQTIDSIIDLLEGCWKWDHYFGGFGGLPPMPATSNVRVEFSQDAQDSLNHTISCQSFEDSILQFSGRCDVEYDTNWAPFFILSCPIFDSIGIVGSPPLYFYFEDDTLLFPQEQFLDGFVYGFLQNCGDTVPQPPDFERIDSVIQVLDGCWKWDHYYGELTGFPPLPATSDVRMEFSQDAQDSLNHTVSCIAYEDSVVQFSGRCGIDDSTVTPFFLMSCPIFDSIGIVGSAPLYFYFKNDTLLFPQESFVDGYVYGFLQNCDDSTVTGSSSIEDFATIYPNPASEQIIIQLKNHGLFKAALFNLVGQQIASGENLAERIAIDVSSFPEGSYFIRIEIQEAVMVRKVLVQR